ncbi:hypothetical protein [Microvirga flavescens]|uniref:hypothetical protein n=1 Tax=Microvirga flavescens TaxID=2249811 RepID=UPI000DD733FB|nr:hypothetical protein [Microvirga flavescens]
MVKALFALALAMIVGGLFTFVLGWDDVLLERGWTTSIAGSVVASSGVLMVGLTMIVLRLTQIRSELVRLSPGAQPFLQAPETKVVSGEAAPLAAGLVAGGAVGAAAGYAAEGHEPEAALPIFDETEQEREEPLISLDDLVVEEEPVEDFAKARDEAFEPRVPDFLIERRETFAMSFSERTEIEEEIPVEEPESEQAEPAAFENEPETPEYAQEPEPEPVEEPAFEPESAPPKDVIGTYNSGDNTYVMFSDGSIEAKTPQGDFRFSSLDELKAFIAGGGESHSST